MLKLKRDFKDLNDNIYIDDIEEKIVGFKSDSILDNKIKDFNVNIIEKGNEYYLENRVIFCINSNIIFYETLYDENASCHLAIGDSFPECIVNGQKLSKEELKELKLNQSKNHVDFMIGTCDLNIIGITENDEEIDIFINGNFSNIFER